MVEEGSIDISPKYQRRERWPTQAQSALIESFLLNIPVPPVYLSEDDYGTYSIIDGKQRLTAIHAFMSGQLTLRSLERFVELEGMSFADLPAPLSNALRVRPYVRAVTLLRQTKPHLKYEVFLRLNTAGTPLSPQEIRNVAFRGRLNDAIYESAEHHFLRQQLKIKGPKSPNYRKMMDAEFVLRFIMLSFHWKNFSGDFRRSLDGFMSSHYDDSQSQVDDIRNRFTTAINRAQKLWGNYAFKRPEGLGWRDQALAGAFDAEMVAAYQLSDSEFKTLADASDKVVDLTRQLYKDDEFETAVRQGTNTPSRVRLRIARLTKALKKMASDLA
ncbi:MAG TPA: DUF262 domain-containing protein [Gemmatimonadetes bacterium]|nr:DUF262 domain-containing protein [Gemmatimonadota bacterium]